MFEQSLLIATPTNKSWSFLASVSVELVGLSLLVLIPLIYGDHLPAFQWRSVTVGPPVRPIEHVVPTTRASSGPIQSRYPHPVFRDLLLPRQASSTASAQQTAMELPPGMISADPGPYTNPIGDHFVKPVGVAGPPPTPVIHKDPVPSGPVRVSQGVQMAKLIRQVMPVYPPMAKMARVSGTVHLLGIIAKDGTIRNLQVIDGNPLLVGAAVDAVSKWVYRPTLLSGEPVEVICPIDVNFTLSQ